MSESGGNRPGDEALHDASRAAIERVQADPKVQELLGKLDAMVASGEDMPLEELAPVAPPPPAPEAEGGHAEHFESVRVGESHKVAHEDKIIVQPKRGLRQVAEEAGVKLDDFKKLEAGNKMARTQVAVRILDHLDEIYAALPRTVGGRTAMLGQPDSVRDATAAGAGPASGSRTDAGGIDPAVRTVGGGTIKGMPAPVPTAGAAPAESPPSSGAPVSGPVESSQAHSRAAGPSQRAAVLVILALAAIAAVVTAVMLRPTDGESTTSAATSASAASEPATATSAAAEPSETASADASAALSASASASTSAAPSADSSAPPAPTRPPTTTARPPSTGKPPSPPPTNTGHKPLFERK